MEISINEIRRLLEKIDDFQRVVAEQKVKVDAIQQFLLPFREIPDFQDLRTQVS